MNASLLQRFPVLRQLRVAGRRRVPFVEQLTETECGVACLAMVLAHHGKRVPRESIRDVLNPGRDGTSARALVDTARHFGLRARGVRVELGALAYLPPGSILHWGFSHYVVLAGVRRRGVEILDPGAGRRLVSFEEMGDAFTGVALVFDAPAETIDGPAPPAPHTGMARRLLTRSGSWPRILVLSAFLQVAAFAAPLFTGTVVDRIVPRADAHLLLVAGVGLALMLVFQLVAGLVRAELLLAMRTVFDAELTLGLVERLTALPYSFFQRRSVGDLMTRLGAHVAIREAMTSGAVNGVLDSIMMAASLALLFVLSPTLGAVAVVLAVVQVAVLVVGGRHLRELSSMHVSTQARYLGYQVEMLGGMETLKALGCDKQAEERFAHLFVDALNAQIRVGHRTAWLDAVGGTLRAGAPLVVLVVGALEVLLGHATLGAMLAACSLAASVFGPLANLASLAGQIESLRSHFERIADVHAAEVEQRGPVRPAAALQGRVELDRASFRYGTLEPCVVQDVSLSIAPGEMVAIVGRSGSGKSSLAAVLMGLHRPSSGRVLYDGLDLRDVDLRGLRRQLGIVTQSTHLFGGSIRSNIALSDPALPMEQIVEAARLAAIHDEIEAMPLGYETLITDGGSSLSGGQRQRIALARALARKPAVLLLDEATSALDALTERSVQESLSRLRCTRIVIAHRLSTVVSSDRILVMDGGRLVEQGTHAELVARPGGIYASLVAGQLRT